MSTLQKLKKDYLPVKKLIIEKIQWFCPHSQLEGKSIYTVIIIYLTWLVLGISLNSIW